MSNNRFNENIKEKENKALEELENQLASAKRCDDSINKEIQKLKNKEDQQGYLLKKDQDHLNNLETNHSPKSKKIMDKLSTKIDTLNNSNKSLEEIIHEAVYASKSNANTLNNSNNSINSPHADHIFISNTDKKNKNKNKKKNIFQKGLSSSQKLFKRIVNKNTKDSDSSSSDDCNKEFNSNVNYGRSNKKGK